MSTAIAIVGNDPVLVQRLQKDLPELDLRFVRARRRRITIPEDVEYVISPRWINHSAFEHAERAAHGRPIEFTEAGHTGIRQLILGYVGSKSEKSPTPSEHGEPAMAKNHDNPKPVGGPAKVNGHAALQITSDPGAYEAMEFMCHGLSRLMDAPLAAAVSNLEAEIKAVDGMLSQLQGEASTQCRNLMSDVVDLRKRLDGFDAFRKDLTGWQKGIQGEVKTWIDSTIRRDDLDELEQRMEHLGDELGSLASSANVHHRSLDTRLAEVTAHLEDKCSRHAGSQERLEQSLRDDLAGVVERVEGDERAIALLELRTGSLEQSVRGHGDGLESVLSRLQSLQKDLTATRSELATIRASEQAIESRLVAITQTMDTVKTRLGTHEANVAALTACAAQPRGLALLVQILRRAALRAVDVMGSRRSKVA